MADFTVKDWMDTGDAKQQETIVRDMAANIDLGLLDIPTFLRGFQSYLDGEATLIEAGKGMELLSKVLTELQTEWGRADVHALVEYFCIRLENKDNVPNFRAGLQWTAKSLQALAKMTARFPRGDASAVAKAIFPLASSFRDQLPATRLAVLNLLGFLGETYSTPLLRDIGAHTFVEGLVSMAEFEKDPYCLKFLFQQYQKISENWALKSESYKSMWDSFSRYYPITLKTTDKSVPSRDELQLLLIGCFASNNGYAAHALPFLLDALDMSEDTLTSYTKNTVLETFEACIDGYSVEIVNEWSSKIWDALKFEIWDATNDEFISRSLKVIHAIGRKLDNGATGWEDLTTPFARYVINTSTECSSRLQDSKTQHILGSGKVLHAVASSSAFGFYLAIKNVLPKMFVIWDDLPSRDKRVPLLEVFNDLLQARVDLNQNSKFRKLRDYDLQVNSQSFESKLASALAAFQQSLVDDVYINAMMEADSEEPAVDTPYKVNAIRGLVLGTQIPGFLSDYHKGTVIQEFSKMAVSHSESEEIHHELITALQQISIQDVTGYKDLTVQTFMAELPDRLDSSTADFTEPANKTIFLLNTLTEISCTETCKVDVVGPLSHPETSFKFRIFEIFQETLLKRLHNLVQHSDQLPYSNAILGAIYRGLQLFDQALEKEETAHLTQIPSTVPAFPQLEAPAEALPEVDNPAPLSATGPYTWILMDLYQKLVCQKPHQGGPLSNLHYMGLKVQFQQDANGSDMFFSLLGRISTLVLRSTQTTPVNNFLFNAEKDGQPSQIWYLFCVEPPTNAIEISQQNLEHGPAEKCLMNVLSMSLLAGIRRTDRDKLKLHIGEAAFSMLKNAVSTNSDCSAYARVSMLQFLQLLVNKFDAGKEVIRNEERNLVKVMLDLTASCDSITDKTEVQHIYHALAYFTAACLSSGDRSTKDLIAQMIDGISHPTVGRTIAQSFRTLLMPSEIMNEQNFCKIRKLRKQRLYELSVDRLVSLWRGTQDKTYKDSYLIALAGVLTDMEPKIVEENAEELLPVILEGTNVKDDRTMFTNVLLIHSLIASRPEVASSHIDSIINRMTHRTHNTFNSPSDASVKCRAAALEVLTLLVSHVEKRILLRRKAKIMAELDIALNDCSRKVRTAAERTKMHWFNLVESGT